MKIRNIIHKLIGASLIIVLTLTAPVQATTFEGHNGKIAFCKTTQGATNIWVMRPDGTHQQQLTFAGGGEPVWSPDGHTMAFIHASGQLYLMDHNGQNQRPLAAEPDSAYSSPVWSADGSYIAFVRTKTTHPKQSAIFSVKPDGSHVKNLSGWSIGGQGYRSPSWSPDGTKIVYEHFGLEFGSLVIKNRLTGASRKLTDITPGTDSEAAWSPNGKKILFKDSPTETYTIWPDGTHRTVISDGDSYHATWSADGTKIAFIEDYDDPQISISGVDGSITYLPIHKSADQRVTSLTWSPNGKKLAFTLATTDPSGNSHLFTLHLTTHIQTKLGKGIPPLAWAARTN